MTTTCPTLLAKCIDDTYATGEHGLVAGKTYEVREGYAPTPHAVSLYYAVFIDERWRNGYTKDRFILTK